MLHSIENSDTLRKVRRADSLVLVLNPAITDTTAQLSYLAAFTNRQKDACEDYWYHPDHLGSSSWITYTDGSAVQHLHYLPWGEDLVDQRLNSFDGVRHTFSAKERDTETGLSYFGSRYYSSELSIWLSVDPMSDKYPSFSPYTYCANNPVKLVDPNGEEIVIRGEDGDFTFTPGSECSSSDWKVKKAWENLNNIYGTEMGEAVINEMTKQGSPSFIFTDKALYSDGTGRFKKDNKGGGTMYMGGQLQTAGYMAHELFHGYQELKKQGGLSIHNEVEANLFAMMTTNYNQALQPLKDFNFTTNYGRSFKAFIMGEVNASNFDKHFGNLRDGFKSSAFDNYNHIYDDFPSGKNNNSLLKEFFK